MNRKRKGIIYYITFVALFFFTFTFLAFAEEGEQQGQQKQNSHVWHALVDSVQQTGATVQNIQLHQGEPLASVSSVTELMEIGEKWRSLLGEEVQVTRNEQGEHPYYQASYIKKDVMMTVKVIGTKQAEQWKPYLIVKISAPFHRSQELDKKVNQLVFEMKQQSIEPQLKTCVQAFYNDKMNHSVRKDQLEKILQSFDATIVEQMEDDVVLSISAYSPHISQHIFTNDMKMNLQVAAHVDHSQRITRVTVGTPIITTTY